MIKILAAMVNVATGIFYAHFLTFTGFFHNVID